VLDRADLALITSDDLEVVVVVELRDDRESGAAADEDRPAALALLRAMGVGDRLVTVVEDAVAELGCARVDGRFAVVAVPSLPAQVAFQMRITTRRAHKAVTRNIHFQDSDGVRLPTAAATLALCT